MGRPERRRPRRRPAARHATYGNGAPGEGDLVPPLAFVAPRVVGAGPGGGGPRRGHDAGEDAGSGFDAGGFDGGIAAGLAAGIAAGLDGRGVRPADPAGALAAALAADPAADPAAGPAGGALLGGGDEVAPATSMHLLATPYRADASARCRAHVHSVDGSGVHRTSRKRRDVAGGVLGALTEVVVVVGMALVLAVVVKTFLVQAFFIPSESMERTLLVGDRVLVSKLTPGPFDLERGDVVVFKDPGGWLTPLPEPQDGAFRSGLRTVLTFVGLLPQDSGEHLIKRVVGLPGDRVQCCDASGRLTVNGVAVDETYLGDGIAPSTLPFDVTVPAGRLWVMGDNRSSSEDSRFHTDLEGGGTVPLTDVVGTAFVVVWPPGRTGRLGTPEGVFASVPAAGGAP